MISLDSEYNVRSEVLIDDDEGEIDIQQEVYIYWKNDAKFFVTNFAIVGKGRKSLIRDQEQLKVFKSAALSDADGMCVQSVSEKPISALRGPVCWQ